MRQGSSKRGTHHAKNGTIGAPGRRSLDDLAVFVAVAEGRSFSAASERLRLPASSVSRAVARLEGDLGVALLRRTSRSVALTEEGRDLLQHSLPHIDGLNDAIRGAGEQAPEVRGLVRVTAPAFTGRTRIARLLAAFAAAHPDVQVELDASNAMRDLVDDGFDFGIRVGPEVRPDFVARRLWQSRFRLYATRAFVRSELGNHGVLTRELAERVPAIVTRANATWTFVDESGARCTIKPNQRFFVNDPRAAVEIARRGIGLVLAPREAVRKRDELDRVKTDFGEAQPTELFVVYPSSRLLPRRVRLAIDWLLAAPARSVSRA